MAFKTTGSRPQSRHLDVLLVITELRVGGAERCLMHLALGLAERGFAVGVVSLASPPSPNQDALVRQLQLREIPVEFLGADRLYQVSRAIRGLRRLIRIHQPRLVHAFLFHAIIITALTPTGAPDRSRIAGLRVTEQPVWRKCLLRILQMRFQRFVCVSQSVADHAHHGIGLDLAKLTVIPNGVAVPAPSPIHPASWGDFGIPHDAPVIVAVGRLAYQKGMDRLVELAPQLLNALPQHHLVIFGDGPLRAQLMDHIRQTPLADRIHLIGWRHDVRERLANSNTRLFVLPSRWEGMPQALMEAMAAGLPIVAMRVEGVEEILGDPDLIDIQTVPLGPHEDLAFTRRIVALLTDPVAAESCGIRNRQRITTHFGLEPMVTRHIGLYQTVGKEVPTHRS